LDLKPENLMMFNGTSLYWISRRVSEGGTHHNMLGFRMDLELEKQGVAHVGKPWQAKATSRQFQ
jgi:hypothetical protein